VYTSFRAAFKMRILNSFIFDTFDEVAEEYEIIYVFLFKPLAAILYK
jgi:hypothetical protein